MKLRRAAKVDTTQETIVRDLRNAGYIVSIEGWPVDISVRSARWMANLWLKAEIKTPNRAGGRYAPDKRQAEQIDFCNRHSVPYWTTSEQALRELNVYDRFFQTR